MKLYTSLLIPSPRSSHARADLRNYYELHRTLSHAFPELPQPTLTDATTQQAADTAREGVRCLFRLDETKQHGQVILVQSRVAPDWERLVTERSGYLIAMPQVKEWEPKLSEGARLTFRLRANPTVKREGKRLPLLKEEEQLQWLARQAQSHGFLLPSLVTKQGGELPQAHLAVEPPQQHRTAGGKTTTHHAVLFEGVLTVTDPVLFAEALAAGIGAAKGFGFGLLSVARA